MVRMSASDDRQNRSEEVSVDLDAGTSLGKSFKDPGTPSSHGLPKAATRARKKRNSDEEYDEFHPEEVTYKKKVVRKEYNDSGKERVVARKVSRSSVAKRGIPPTSENLGSFEQVRQTPCLRRRARRGK
jgi:hypothetical protein